MSKRKNKQSQKTSAPRAAAEPSTSDVAPAAEEQGATTTEEHTESSNTSIKKRVLVTSLLFLALAAATFAAHGLCLKNPFYLDDQLHILKSAKIHSGDWWGSNGLRAIPRALWIWLRSVVGFDPVAFHALNLIVHGLTVFATYFAARELARIEQVKQYLAGTPIARSFPFFAALLFAVHALCSEVTNYASQTSIELVTLFTVIATGAMFRWVTIKKWWWLTLAFLATGLATLSKEVGIWHTIANLVFVAVIFWKALPIFNRQKPIPRKPLIIASVLVLAIGCYFIQESRYTYLIRRIFTDPEMGLHWLTQSRIFWEYIWRMFLPFQLCSDHWVPVTRSTGDVVAWIGAIGIIALVASTVVLFWRQRIYCLLLALTLTPLLFRFAYLNKEPFVEYRAYPCMPWFCMLAVLFAGAFLMKRMRPGHFAIGATIVCTLFAGICAKRSATWNSAHALVIDIRKQYPLHIRSQSYIQGIDFANRDYQAVIDRQVLARRMIQDIFKFNQESEHRKYLVSNSLSSYMFCEQFNAYALIELKRPKDAIARTTQVIAAVSKVVNSDTGQPFAVLYRVRGKAHAALREFGPAAADYRRALERKPKDLETPQLIRQLPPQFRAAAIPQPQEQPPKQ
ncbi:hypothetical protein [Haloferula sp.]|uniref:hypothetical protein n=1 Tax=Haloferula sp. TaxID=2497595 RepID=UPI00329C81D5